jgi:ABC-2 type transport system permease protein
MGYGFGSIYQQAGQGDYISFLVPGIIGMSIIFTSIFSGMEIIWDRQFGFLKETLVAPVSRFNIMFGRTLGGATVATIQGIIVLLVAMLIGFRPYNWIMVLPAILVMFLVALLFTAFGTMIASKLDDMQGFQLIINFLVMPLFFLSGALFPLQGLPKVMLIIAKFDPLSYGVDGVKAFLLGTSHFAVSTDLIVLGVVTFVFLWLGSYFFSKIQA